MKSIEQSVVEYKLNNNEVNIGDIFRTLDNIYYLVEKIGNKFLVMDYNSKTMNIYHFILDNKDLNKLLISKYEDYNGSKYRYVSFKRNDLDSCLKVYSKFLKKLSIEDKRDFLLNNLIES